MANLTTDGHNPNLKIAGAYDATETGEVDKTHFAAYSFQKGNLNDFCVRFFPNDPNNASSGCELTGDNHTDVLEKLTLGGQIAVSDISRNNGQNSLFPSSSLNEMDLLHSTFESCEITVPGAFGQNDSGGDYTRKSTVTTECGDVITHDTVTRWPGETITSNALYYLSNYSLVTCVLPEGNTEIPPHTFASSSGTGPIRNITIPEGYTRIGFEAFYGHDLLTLELPSTLQVVEAGAFRDVKTQSQLTDVTMKPLQGTCTFGEAVFMRNFMLKHVTLSEGVTNISDYMFNQCYLLESIRIPSTCRVIGVLSFYETFDLHSVTIPEGVEYILEKAFELGGLTDLYIMATSLATLPKIFSMDPTYNQSNQSGASFTYQRTSGNNTVPTAHLQDEDFTSNNPHHWDVGYEDVVTWYQEELSDERGVGTGNALVALHYPDEMKGFYEGIDVSDFFPEGDLNQYVYGWRDSGRDGTTGGWIEMASSNYQGNNFQNVSKWLVNGKYGESNYNGTNNATGDDILQYLPQAYSVNPWEWESSGPRMGPDKDNVYYPNQTDYVMRLAAGATDNGVGQCPSAWGWRQFPLAYSIGDMGKVPFDKLYDDTWYTMCFPWHMTDEELFEAFNQQMEIVEFVGVEMIEQGDHDTNVANNDFTYEMVMHFDDVAVTTYRDNNDVEYDRVKIGTREINGEVRNVYRYTSKDGNNTVVEYPLKYTDLNNQVQNADKIITTDLNPSAEQQALREAYGKYLTIQNILSLAGHPYMIHPSIGANPGNPATVYINATPRTGEQWTPENQAVTKPATVDDPNWDKTQYGNEYNSSIQNESGIVPFENPITHAGGSYTFIGNVGDVSKLLGEEETGTGSGSNGGSSTSSEYDSDGNKVMPTPAYFLAVPQVGTTMEDVYEDQSVPVFEDDGVTPVMEYKPQEGGNYNKVITPAYYEYVGTNGDYTASAWTEADPAGSGYYQKTDPTIVYVNAGEGTHTATAWTLAETAGEGHYNQGTTQKDYYELGSGGYYGTYFPKDEGQNVGENNGLYDKVEFDRNGTVKYIFVFRGPGQGSWNVEFEQRSGGEWGYNVGGQYNVPIYTYAGASGGGDYEATAFAEQSGGEVNYIDNYVYHSEGGQDYVVSGYTPQEGGEYLYHPEVVEYVQTAEGEGSYVYVQKTRIEQVLVGQKEVPVYGTYPKFYRKKQTTGNKWSKYSAIIKPDANAITNIENYLNYQQAQANGFNVSFGEWEEVTTTAIKKIVEEAEQRNEPVQKIHLNVVYNIKGQVVRNGSTSLEGLPKGLYIVNGKKYMVK
ncbi:MAG: leucine-rich repeat domain-containing protein [Prevotella sp.]|nr:leucine-rich repeat domain-containing protein [Prevotella sp.]